jgi:hypothetical protein
MTRHADSPGVATGAQCPLGGMEGLDVPQRGDVALLCETMVAFSRAYHEVRAVTSAFFPNFIFLLLTIVRLSYCMPAFNDNYSSRHISLKRSDHVLCPFETLTCPFDVITGMQRLVPSAYDAVSRYAAYDIRSRSETVEYC